jgi:PhzF family phenazine biosynthesis protein
MDVVDVFAEIPYGGNPLAVVRDGEGLSDEQMQRFANWMNLSETTYLLAPTDPAADYRVRIFTPSSELPFAGHPTLGSCHAWLASGATSKREGIVLQQCGAGVIELRRQREGWLAFAAPPLVRSGPLEDSLRAHVAAVLGLSQGEIVDAQWADNGPGWVGVLLASAEAVLALHPSGMDLAVGVIGPYPPGAPEAFEVRAFLPADGSTIEDPVTGSLNASLAQWLVASGRASAPYVVSQGTALGRRGRVHIECDDAGAIWVEGDTATRISGTVEL